MPGISGSIGNGILGEYFPEREYNLLDPKRTRKLPKFQPCPWLDHVSEQAQGTQFSVMWACHNLLISRVDRPITDRAFIQSPFNCNIRSTFTNIALRSQFTTHSNGYCEPAVEVEVEQILQMKIGSEYRHSLIRYVPTYLWLCGYFFLVVQHLETCCST